MATTLIVTSWHSAGADIGHRGHRPPVTPVEAVWSHLKRSPANLTRQSTGQLTAPGEDPAQTDPLARPHRRASSPGPHSTSLL